jgi:hypothetical protein
VRRLEPLEGTPGRSLYRDGQAGFEWNGRTLVARPSFPLRHAAEYEFLHVEPLLREVSEDHLVGTVLVRLGGYAVGVFAGEELVDSKVGSRLVHGRHRAGGSSANRFRRRREEQARALLAEAAEVAARVLGPRRAELEAVALGGDRTAVRGLFEARPDVDWIRSLALDRFFSVPDPRRTVLERLPYDLYAVELTEIDDGGAVG